MAEKATIRIEGPWASVAGVGIETFRPVLSALDPKAVRMQAFKEERWDGIVELYEGNRFPAGLTQRVIDFCKKEKINVRLIDKKRPDIDLTKLTPNYIEGITLRPHQFDAAMKLLLVLRGSIKSPTASGKTLLSYVLARYLYDLYGWRSLVMTPTRGLVRQTARCFRDWAKHDMPIGEMGDGKKTVGPITVGTPNTLSQYKATMRGGKFIAANRKIIRMLENVQIYIADECHRASGQVFHDIGMQCVNAVCRFGMSGTPLVYRKLKDLKMIGLTGPIVYSVRAKKLIDAKFAAKPKIAMIMSDAASGPKLPKVLRTFRDETTGHEICIKVSPQYADIKKNGKIKKKGSYRLGIIENEHHNRAVLHCTEWFVEHAKRQTLVICRMKDHWKLLRQMIDESGLKYAAIWGATTTANRDYAKAQFAKRGVNVLFASSILDLGEDVPAIAAIVLAEGGKANTNALQRIGRGMRIEKGGPEDVWIADLVSTSAPVHIRHGLARCEWYEREGYETELVTDWPEEDELGERFTTLLPFDNWDR